MFQISFWVQHSGNHNTSSNLQCSNWLVVKQTPLKNMSSSIGMMNFPIYGKIKHVPNHQPGNLWKPTMTATFMIFLGQGLVSMHAQHIVLQHEWASHVCRLVAKKRRKGHFIDLHCLRFNMFNINLDNLWWNIWMSLSHVVMTHYTYIYIFQILLGDFNLFPKTWSLSKLFIGT